MDKPRLYVETTVVSFLVGRPSRDVVVAGLQVAVQQLWPDLHKRFDPYVSGLVMQEAAKGDAECASRRLAALRGVPVLDVDEEAKSLAVALTSRGAIPASVPEDALHIALAAVNGMDLIVTCNFKHINNPVTRWRIRETVADAGYEPPELCSPTDLTGIQDE